MTRSSQPLRAGATPPPHENRHRISPWPLRSHAAPLLLAALIPAGCESEVEPEETFEEGVIVVDATSPVEFAYLSLADGGSLVSPPDPATSTEWHMAFRRFTVRLNGGVAGPGSVSGLNRGDNADLTAQEITELTSDDGVEAFRAVTDADIPASSSFTEDELVPDPGATWFRFDPRSGTIVANPRVAWRVRESSGRGHAIFRVTDLEMDGRRPLGLTIEYRRHDPGAELGSAGNARLSFARGPVYLELKDGSQQHDSAGCGWDLSASPELVIGVNADCGAGTFPVDAAEDFADLENADDAPEYGGFLSAIAGAFPVTVDDAGGIFWYNIRENSRMWPTYNVFLVHAEDETYKVQILAYYNEAGESGHQTVKFQRLR